MRSTVAVRPQVLNENVHTVAEKTSKVVSQSSSRNPFQDISNQQTRANQQKTVAQKPTIVIPSVVQKDVASAGAYFAQPTNHAESIEIEGDESNKQNRRRKASDGDMGKPLRHSLR